VTLDRTAFYPESGGQPADYGCILAAGGRAVWRVLGAREEGGVVLHIVAASDEAVAVGAIAAGSAAAAGPPQPGAVLTGRIDWPRRHDHMQQHCGQHVLSGALVRVAGANTVAFHLSDQSVTIDVDRPALDASLLEAAEAEANRVVFEDLPVTAAWHDPTAAAGLPLRKPPAGFDRIRVVEVEGFDWSACGGTHPRRTGEVGLIKILAIEKARGNARIHFACGHRARLEFSRRVEVTAAAGAVLAAPLAEIPEAVRRLVASQRQLAKDLERARADLLVYEAAALWDEAARAAPPAPGAQAGGPAAGGSGPVVASRIFRDRDPAEVRSLAVALAGAREDTFAVFGLVWQGQAHLLVARAPRMSDPSAPDARTILAEALPLLDGRGGGSSAFAQGGGPRVDAIEEAVRRAVARASSRPL
jgi:alanyl-tRNA synthetase